MSLDEKFTKAQERVKSLSRAPSNDDLLALYGLYKQATVGDVQGKRPGMLDMRGRAKYDAWSGRTGMSADAAKEAYIGVVDRLCGPA